MDPPDDGGLSLGYGDLQDATGADADICACNGVQTQNGLMHLRQIEIKRTDRKINRHDFSDVLPQLLRGAINGHQFDHEFGALFDGLPNIRKREHQPITAPLICEVATHD